MNNINIYDGSLDLTSGYSNKNPYNGPPLYDGSVYRFYWEQCPNENTHDKRRFSIMCLYSFHSLSTPQISSLVPCSDLVTIKNITPQSLSCYKVRIKTKYGSVSISNYFGEVESEEINSEEEVSMTT